MAFGYVKNNSLTGVATNRSIDIVLGIPAGGWAVMVNESPNDLFIYFSGGHSEVLPANTADLYEIAPQDNTAQVFQIISVPTGQTTNNLITLVFPSGRKPKGNYPI